MAKDENLIIIGALLGLIGLVVLFFGFFPGPSQFFIWGLPLIIGIGLMVVGYGKKLP